MESDECTTAIGRYAARLHARAEGHHVVSALGAWILVALCADLADDATLRRELTEALGVETQTASAFAADLLAHPHPLVAAATGAWFRHSRMTPRVELWERNLPASVETGELPTQEEIDRWSTEHTYGLINEFPIRLSPDTFLLLASAVATKVSWDSPFDVVEASLLGPTRWSERLRWVLRSPKADPRHRQFVVDAEGIGKAVVHLTGARGGLLVGSVIAADETAPRSDVLALAHHIVTGEARNPNSVARLSLFDLPSGEGPVWTISETGVETTAPDGREENVVAILPAWSAETDLELADDEALGFATAARIVGQAFGIDRYVYDARQSAVARYGAVGFEAAAVTGIAVATSAPRRRPGLRRNATVRFAHPYAVVAAACDEVWRAPREPELTAWRGLPIFSAWVSAPCDAEPSGGSRSN